MRAAFALEPATQESKTGEGLAPRAANYHTTLGRFGSGDAEEDCIVYLLSDGDGNSVRNPPRRSKGHHPSREGKVEKCLDTQAEPERIVRSAPSKGSAGELSYR